MAVHWFGPNRHMGLLDTVRLAFHVQSISKSIEEDGVSARTAIRAWLLPKDLHLTPVLDMMFHSYNPVGPAEWSYDFLEEVRKDTAISIFKLGTYYELYQKLSKGPLTWHLLGEAMDILYEDQESKKVAAHDAMLAAALCEARDALNGAPNTAGLHAQIEDALAKAKGGGR